MKMVGLLWYCFVFFGLKLNIYIVGFYNEKLFNLENFLFIYIIFVS